MTVPALLVALICIITPAVVNAQQIDNGIVAVSPIGQAGAYTGFLARAGDTQIGAIMFASNDALRAEQAQVHDNTLRFSAFQYEPTPRLGDESWVEVRVLPNDPYPEVRFNFDLAEFDADAWEASFGRVPVHFLACSVPGAEVFHQRGWPIGTPVVDDYIQMKAEGFGRQVVSSWSRNWTYAPPIGAYPTATAGLWHPSDSAYIGYDFHGARLTDHSEKNIGTSYCYECGESEQFFCVTWPFAERYIELRYPDPPIQFGTHFRILWSRDMGPGDDPNRFAHEFIWDRYADLLPDVERMNDLSWLPDVFRITGFDRPGDLGNFVRNAGDEPRWWEPNVNIVGGVGYFSPIDYYFAHNDQGNIRTLAAQCRRIVDLGGWLTIDGDRCFYWKTPLDGGGAEFFGDGVQTYHHVNNWHGALALLDYYRNDPDGAADLLPYIDGLLNLTRHILYTRNGYPDVPAAQFAWSATPCVTFCLKYYYHFRDEADHQQQAELAHKLAREMTYRYLAIWPCDNDEMDDLDSSFLMEPNAGLNWLGSACANEIWVYNIAMLYEYVATGDPIMGHYLRGMLERYHEMFRNEVHDTVRDYGTAFCERFGFFDECAQGKGSRSGHGGLWGGFERLIWPIGPATARVVCGEKAAMCFNREGRHTDIADYRYYGDADFSFTLVPGGLQAEPDAPLELTVSFPFFDLSNKNVTVSRGDDVVELTGERITRYEAEPSTVNVSGLKLGDTVTFGSPEAGAEPLPCDVAKPREAPPQQSLHRDTFEMFNLAGAANAGITRDWQDLQSYAGYEPGVRTLWGVPFLLLDPELTGNKVCVEDALVPLGRSPQYLFALVADIGDGSELAIHRPGGDQQNVDLTGAIPALRGWPPIFRWKIQLVAVENDGNQIEAVQPTNCKLFATTGTDATADDIAETLGAIADEQADVLQHRKTVAKLQALAPLFSAYSGHIAVLPDPKQGNVYTNPAIAMLHEAGLAKHIRILSPEDLVNPEVFNSENVWIALYLGGETYYQTVNQGDDGDRALLDWLKTGGTLVSLASGPFPFYYDESSDNVVNAGKFGLPIAGSGVGEVPDTLDVAETRGWEDPPEGVQLHFHVNPDQRVLTNLPETIPWPEDADQRWRPALNVVGDANDYTPVVTLKDGEGRDYGEAVAMIDYKAGRLAGARVVYVWHSFRLGTGHQPTIVSDLFRYLLTYTLRPTGDYTCVRTSNPPTIDGKLDDEVWQRAPAIGPFLPFGDNQPDDSVPKTTTQMTWDDDALYIAWRCEDPDIWATMTERDRNLWEEEVVEVYVDPDGDGRNYREFEFNPLNNIVDLKISHTVQGAPQDVEEGRKWDADGIRSQVTVDGTVTDREDRDRSWVTEVAIPLSNFPTARSLPPRIGDTWRMQLLRIDRSSGLQEPAFTAWSATDTFHNPNRFGWVTFGANPYDEDFAGYEQGAVPTPTWTPTSGEWLVRDEALVGRNSGTDGFLPTGIVGGPADLKDFRLRLRFQVRETGSDHRDGAWIGFRYRNPGQCYSLNFRSNSVVLSKAYRGRSSGDFNYLAQADWTRDNLWHEVQITAEGAHIRVELDGEILAQATDDEYLNVPTVPAGAICLSARRWSNSEGNTVVAFDDIRIEPLP